MRDLFAAMALRCRRSPHDTALIHVKGAGVEESASVGDLSRRVLAHVDSVCAFDPGAVVPIFHRRSIDCVALMLAAAAGGRVFSCLNTRLKPTQIEPILHQARARAVLCDDFGRRQLERTASDELRGKLAVPSPLQDGSLTDDTVADRLDAIAQAADADKASCCLFTSGSTGVPKGVLISGGDLVGRAAAEIDAYDLRSTDRLLNVLPFAFDVGLNQLITSLLSGATLVLLDSWMPADLLKAVERGRITGISGVPAVWRDLRASGLSPDTTGVHRSLRYITVSGGSLAPREVLELQALLPGVRIFKTYGQTESFRSTILRPEQLLERPGSVGRPFAGARVRVVDDSGQPCPPDQVGEVVHSGLGVMMGYLNEESDRSKRRPNPFQHEPGESPFAIWTGDAGYLDSDGYLYLRGRRDGMLKVSGNRFYADEVVAAITALPGIADVEVLGLDPDAVESRVAAFVVTKSHQTAAEISRWLEARLASYMVPRLILVLPALPRLANGKTDRVQLRTLAAGDTAIK